MSDSEVKNSEETANAGSKIVVRVIEDEMKQSYIDYAMSVIVSRALPDVRDGLKPVHRRVLYGMLGLGNASNKPTKKSARIVGEILGKYHPHGDSAVYDTLVRMAQDFSLRYPLVQGQGNFGSIDGDRAAAQRYTEVRLRKIAEELLEDLDKETVTFTPNFDGTLKEPTVLPSKVPNLLINGSSGIAVGMATNIPPHNLQESCTAVIKVIDDPETPINELISVLQGPDFPTGGIICGSSGIKQYFKTGRGKLTVRAKTHVEERKNREVLVITEIPYMVNKSLLLEEIASLVRNKKIEGIADLRDESDKEGMRIVIELKTGVNADVIQNQLFKHSRLQTTFGVNLIALHNGQPAVMNVKQVIEYFIEHRKEIVQRRTEFELKKAKEKAHILEGIIIALDHIDEVIEKIKKSENAAFARDMLMKDYSLTEIQAKAILEMRLQRLAAMEQEKVRADHKDLLGLMKKLQFILNTPAEILRIIKEELAELSKTYGDERKTRISAQETDDFEMEDLIEEEQVVVTRTHAGYIKRLSLDEYRQQKRGGRGVKGASTKEEDFIEQIFVASTKDYLLLFTDQGRVHWLRVYNLPVGSRQAKGKALVNLVQLAQGERIRKILSVSKFDENHFLLFATKNGKLKKTVLSEYSSPRKGGIRAITLADNDELVKATVTDGSKNIVIATRNGLALKCSELTVRPMGRTAAGVRGIKLKKDDYVIGMETCDENDAVLTVTTRGYGKRSLCKEYRQTNRGGVGVTNMKLSEKTGKVVTIKTVVDEDELMLISQKGVVIRIPIRGISIYGRATQGVRVMRLDEDNRLVAAAHIANEEQ